MKMKGFERAEQLQFLRFLAFMLIFLWHSDIWVFIDAPRGNGAAEAVSFFFMLSGLVAGYSAFGREITLGIKHIGVYIWKKLLKFYPLYFVTTVFTVMYSGIPLMIANHNFVSIKEPIIQLFKNLFLIQSWFPTNYFSYNGVGWFLSSILFLYLLNIPAIFVLNLIYNRKRKYIYFFLLITLLISITITYCYCLQETNMEFWTYIFPPARMGEYFSSMIVGFVIRSILPKMTDSQIQKIIFTCLEIMAIGVSIYVLYIPVISWQFRIVHWFLPNLYLLSIFAIGKGYISQIFKNKNLIILGNISFECFLIHQLIIRIYAEMSGVGNFSKLGNVFSIVFCLGITVSSAYIVNGMPLRKKINPKIPA